MLKKYFLKLSFCFGFLALGANASALDFTLEKRGDQNANGYDYFYNGRAWFPPQAPYQVFAGEVGAPRASNASVQWMAFDFETENMFDADSGSGGHLFFATRVNWDQNPASYIMKQYFGQGKGIFIGLPGWQQIIDNDYNNPYKDAINCSDKSIPQVYWELRFPNMTLSRSDYLGFIPAYNAPQYPTAYPSGFFVKCANANIPFKDNTTYSVAIHSAPDGMAYWISRDGNLLSYNYIADNDFTPMYQEGVGDFYSNYTIFADSARSAGYYIYSRSNKKSGVVNMLDVKQDTYAASYVNMQNTNKMIGIFPMINSPSQWKVKIKNFASGWF